MGLDLYYTELSPDNQSVLMLLQLLDIPVNKKVINIRVGEQKTPEFLKVGGLNVTQLNIPIYILY